MRPRSVLLSLLSFFCAWLALSLLPARTDARSIISSGAAVAQVRDRFAIGTTLASPNTLKIATQDELIRRTAGGVTERAFRKYGGDFAKYWQVRQSQHAGKVFEAMVASVENRRLARLGREERIVVTAVEKGGHTHPADLLLADRQGMVARRYQLKLGWKAAREALYNPKYAGMTILPPSDEMEVLTRELAKAEAKAARRGVPLAPKWAQVRNAIEEGRITSRLPSGATTPRRSDVTMTGRRSLQAAWAGRERLVSNSRVGRAVMPSAATWSRVGRFAGKALIVVDVAATGYQTYRDVQLYRAGQIGGVHLTARITTQGVRYGLICYAVASPEPVGKTVAVAAVLVLVIGDEVNNRLYQARRERLQQMLEAIDRDERYHAVGRQLLDEYQLLHEVESTGAGK